MRRCLDCFALIRSGSRCERHRLEYERARDRQRGVRRVSRLHGPWARAVKDRAGWRCQVRGCRTPTDRPEAHHILPLKNGGGYQMSNGICLCWGHHREIHRGESAAETA